MANVAAAVLLSLLLWLGCAGIGMSIHAPRRSTRPPSDHRDGDRAAPSWDQMGLAACIGLAALLSMAGIAMLLQVSAVLACSVFVVVGLVLLAARVGPQRTAPIGRVALVCSVVAALAFGLVLVTQAALGLTLYPNECDDLLAYVPMANRLLDTGHIIEPWSLRRAQNLGGASVLQAVPIGMLGNGAYQLAETLIASTFLAGLFLTHRFRALPSRVACIVAILLYSVAAVPRASSSAVLLVVPLLVAVFGVASELRGLLLGGPERTLWRWAAAGGLLLGGCAALRINVVPAAAAALLVGIVLAPGASMSGRVRTAALSAGVATVSLVAWALGLWQSSGTPAYPLIPGNTNLDAPSSRDPALHGLLDIAARGAELLRAGPYLWAALAVLGLSIVARRWLPDARLLWIVTLSVLGNMALLALYLTASSAENFARYVFPLSFALVVFFVYEVIRGTEPLEITTLEVSPLVVLASALLVLAYVSSLFTSTAAVSNTWERTSDTLSSGDLIEGVEASFTAASRRDYRAALALARGGGRTIAAVDRPYLIDYRRDDIQSLDLPGWAAPDGDFPFFDGVLPKIRVLRRAGYHQLLATVPERNACMSPGSLRARIAREPRPAPLYATYYLDWERGLAAIARRAPSSVRRVGTLVLIDLDRAYREMTASVR
jgi:hypothetical protein